MRESFVIHTEYIEDLPEENKAEFLMYIYNYGAKGIEPELAGFAKTVWLKIQRRIDADREQYENTINARSAAGRKHKGNQYTKAAEEMEQNGTNGTQYQITEQDGTNGTVNEFESDNEFDNENDTDTETGKACVPAYIPDPNQKQINRDLAGTLLNMIQKHNSMTTKDRKVPVSNNVFNFCCKEMRELIPALRPGSGEAATIINALENFLKVCRSDTWMKSHTWSNFCKHYTDYTPEFFTLERYLNAEPQDGDASKKPENAFFFAHKDNPNFHVETFQKHIDDWKAEGRPDGAAYRALQDKWEAEDAD